MACIVACKTENSVPREHFRTRVIEKVDGKFPELRMEIRSELCNHCDDPPCVHNCPTGASYKNNSTGMVLLKKNRCVGCKACIAACPYDARYMHPKDGYADKCTFCEHRVSKGKKPACVSTCIGKSRIFGDIDDPESEVSNILRNTHHEVLKPSTGTRPRVYYVNRFTTKGY